MQGKGIDMGRKNHKKEIVNKLKNLFTIYKTLGFK